MKTIKINFVDFFSGFNKEENEFIDVLSKKYNVVLSDDPEYLFFSCFGYDHLKYDCIKIFYTGECIVPNFNECDYAIGFDDIHFADRYVRIPLYLLFQYRSSYQSLFNRPLFTKEDLSKKESFCSFVYSNCFAQDQRTMMFNLLSEYKHVSSGGRYLNNIGGAVKDKQAFQQKHKFSIAFENTSYRGYTTEKLTEAFAARTIPIYMGNPDVAKKFNTKAFINAHDYDSFEDVVRRVREIDSDDAQYLDMINQPPVLPSMKEDGYQLLSCFLHAIFDQEYELAFRKPNSQTTIAQAKMISRHALFEKYIFGSYSRVMNQIHRLLKGTILTRKRKV